MLGGDRGGFTGTLYHGGEQRYDPSGTFGAGNYFTSERQVAEAYALQNKLQGGPGSILSKSSVLTDLYKAKSYDALVNPVRAELGRAFKSSKEAARLITQYYQGKGYRGGMVSEHGISKSDTIVVF